MPFIEQEASIRYEIINGKKVPVITPKSEVTLINKETGKEYMSDAEALADIQNPNTSTKAEHVSSGIENLKKQMSKIADDEYYASLQKYLERDPGAKYFDPEDLSYIAMDKSGEYNYKGFTPTKTKEPDYVKEYMKKRKIDNVYSPEATLLEKMEKGKTPIAILQEPVKTGKEPGDLDKILTILHESRHKIMNKPEFKNIIDKYGIKEETFIRFLDKEFFPESNPELPEFVNPKDAYKIYGEAVQEYKNICLQRVGKLIKLFQEEVEIFNGKD
jgi:hypothetical protein